MAGPNRRAVAKAFAEDLRRREGRNLVAIGVFGSVARGDDRSHSDVDMLVVVRRKRPTIRHTIRSGVLVTVLQQTPEDARAEVAGHHPGLNDALGGWRSLRPLYDPSGLLHRLHSKARRPSLAAFRRSARLHFIETYEDLGKLWNAIDSGDADEAREMAIWYSGAAMGTLFDLEAHVLESGRRAFIEIRRYGALGATVRRLRYEALPMDEALRLSESVWSQLLDRAAAKGVRLPRFPRHTRGIL